MNRTMRTFDPRRDPIRSMLTRRTFLRDSLLGSIALAALGDRGLAAMTSGADSRAPGPLDPRAPHFAPRAKRVIWLHQSGAPSQLDLFDEKPALQPLDLKVAPDWVMKGQRFAFLKGTPHMLASRYKFARHGECGANVSELLPQIAGIVDEISFVRSMHTDEFNHVPAELLLETGSPRQGRPCMGSWVTYGIGSESSNLPGFVVLASGTASRCGNSCFSSGFLPTVYQGVQFRSQGDAVLYLNDPPGIDRELRRASLDALKDLNQHALAASGDPEITTRIEQYELAYRMQASVPELMDIASESEETRSLYGAEPGKSSYANNCLLARRLIERGVRFVQLVHGGWDHHGGGDQNLVTNLPVRCQETDRASAALVIDLKRRGLLDDTLVIWGGEFGRTPMLQQENFDEHDYGRDHQSTAWTMWFAGGGVKKGFSLGATDEFGIKITEDPVHVHDFAATVLHLLGLDHTRLTFRHQGRDYRLTDVSGEVVTKLIA